MNKLIGLFPTAVLLPSFLMFSTNTLHAETVLNDGLTHVLDYTLNDNVLLSNSTNLNIVGSGAVNSPVSSAIYSTGGGTLVVSDHGSVVGNIRMDSASQGLRIDGDALIQGLISFNDIKVNIGGNAAIQGDISGSGLGLRLSGHAKVLGLIDTNGGSSAMKVDIRDSVFVQGNINGRYEYLYVNMSGGHVVGAISSAGGGSLTISNGFVEGGYRGSFNSLFMTGGRIVGGKGLDAAYVHRGRATVAGGKLQGGFGDDVGGDAIEFRYSTDEGYNYTITGGTFEGGDGNSIGGSAIQMPAGGLDIFGGMFNAGNGGVDDGWLISAFDVSGNGFDHISIYGGIFGNHEAGNGFGLGGEAIFDIYGRDLQLTNGVLTGWLRDGNYINVAVYFDPDFTGQFNLHAVPVPAAAWLFGSGLLGLTGISRRKA